MTVIRHCHSTKDIDLNVRIQLMYSESFPSSICWSCFSGWNTEWIFSRRYCESDSKRLDADTWSEMSFSLNSCIIAFSAIEGHQAKHALRCRVAQFRKFPNNKRFLWLFENCEGLWAWSQRKRPPLFWACVITAVNSLFESLQRPRKWNGTPLKLWPTVELFTKPSYDSLGKW